MDQPQQQIAEAPQEKPQEEKSVGALIGSIIVVVIIIIGGIYFFMVRNTETEQSPLPHNLDAGMNDIDAQL